MNKTISSARHGALVACLLAGQACATTPLPYGIGIVDNVPSKESAQKLASDRAKRSLLLALGLPIGFKFVRDQGRSSITLDTSGRLSGVHRMQAQYRYLGDGAWLARMEGSPKRPNLKITGEIITQVEHTQRSRAYTLALERALTRLVERSAGDKDRCLEGTIVLSKLAPEVVHRGVKITLAGSVKASGACAVASNGQSIVRSE